jgi:site-specific recombinase XerD
MTCEAITRICSKRKLAVRTVVQHVAAIRFLYAKTLKRRDMKEDLPYPRNYRQRLPAVLSPEEAMRLIDSARIRAQTSALSGFASIGCAK